MIIVVDLRRVRTRTYPNVPERVCPRACVPERMSSTVQRSDLNKATMPYWVKLVRAGEQLTGYESSDGKDWKQTGTATLKLPEAIYVGLVASLHMKDKLCTVPFDHVSVTEGAQ